MTDDISVTSRQVTSPWRSTQSSVTCSSSAVTSGNSLRLGQTLLARSTSLSNGITEVSRSRRMARLLTTADGEPLLPVSPSKWLTGQLFWTCSGNSGEDPKTMKVERVGRKTNQSQKKRYWLTDQTNQRALKSKQVLMTSWTNHKRVLRVCPSYKEFWSIWINWKRFWSIKTNCKTSEASKKGIFKRATVLNLRERGILDISNHVYEVPQKQWFTSTTLTMTSTCNKQRIQIIDHSTKSLSLQSKWAD